MDRLGEPRAAEAGDIERLHTDRLMLTDHLGGGLVVEVPTGAGPPRVQTSGAEAGFLPVPAALALVAQVALGAAQRPLPLPQPPRIVDFPAVRQRGEAGQAQVDPDRCLGWGERSRNGLNHKDGDRGCSTGPGSFGLAPSTRPSWPPPWPGRSPASGSGWHSPCTWWPRRSAGATPWPPSGSGTATCWRPWSPSTGSATPQPATTSATATP